MSRFDHNLEPDGLASRAASLAVTGAAVSGPEHPTTATRHAGTGVQSWPNRVADTLATWDRRRRYRRELAQMDAHLLSDIGLTPGAASAEADKPFWRP